MRLQNKVAIITGAATGMGTAEARLFAEAGAAVVATDINEEQLKKTVAAIKDAGGEIIGMAQDVTDEAQWQRIVELTESRYGQLNVLVNNAAVAVNNTFAGMSMDEWNAVMNVNLNGCVLGMKYCIPAMQRAGSGSIINISSIAGIVGMAGSSPYTAAKGALRALSKSAAVEYGRDNIRVNSVHPGVIATPMTEEAIIHAGDYFKTHTQLPYFGAPEDVAHGVLFLASDESRFMTGAELVIDGGWTAL